MTDQPILHTDRLTLRPFVLRDALDVQELAGDRAIADTTLNVPHPYSPGLAEMWISTHGQGWERGEQAAYAITLDGKVVGAISLMLTRRFLRGELGYWVGRSWWGHGLCTEAARALVQLAFTDDRQGGLGLHKVYATHLVRNPASGRVMRKLGMKHEGTLRQHVLKWGEFEDVETYGLLRGELLS